MEMNLPIGPSLSLDCAVAAVICRARSSGPKHRTRELGGGKRGFGDSATYGLPHPERRKAGTAEHTARSRVGEMEQRGGL